MGQEREPLWREHLTLILSAALTMFIALKILAVGNYNPETALGIVQVAGTTNVVIAGLISILPLISMSVVMQGWARYNSSFRKLTGTEKMAVLMAMSIPLVLVLAVAPIATYLGILALFLLLRLVALAFGAYSRKYPPKEANQEPPSDVELRSIQMASLAGLALVTITSSWMPLEAVTIKDEPAISAYVVGERGSDTVVLPTSRGAELVVVPTEDVHRTYCSNSSRLSVTLFQVIQGQQYDDCPDD